MLKTRAPGRAMLGAMLIASILMSLAVAQPAPALVQKLDAIAGAGVLESRAVGLVAAVAKGKDTLLIKAYGKADIEGGVPMTADTVIPIGSVTKQFTAAAILQLRDQGKLGLDDEITEWLPDFDTGGSRVTLRHLLVHTSGITELSEIPAIRAMRLITNASATFDEVYRIASRQPFRFPAGTLQIYTNTNYWLLGRIIEKASGMTYEDYIEKRIFEPLGMSRSMYCNDSEDVPRRARGHRGRDGVFRRAPAIVHTATYAAGALCSTAADLITWLQALHGGKVLTAKSYAEMIAPGRLNDGTAIRYGLGLAVGEDGRGLRYIGHNGGGFGFSSETRWFPDTQHAVVLLTNSEPDELTVVSGQLAAALMPVPPPAGPFKGDAALIAGTYRGPGRGREMVVEVTGTPEGIAFSVDGRPFGPLPWVRDWTFRRNDSLFVFRRSGNTGPATELRFDTSGEHFILKRQ